MSNHLQRYCKQLEADVSNEENNFSQISGIALWCNGQQATLPDRSPWATHISGFVAGSSGCADDGMDPFDPHHHSW